LADLSGATLVILDNLGWYCDVARRKGRKRNGRLKIKTKRVD
jgi:hypothetical protein